MKQREKYFLSKRNFPYKRVFLNLNKAINNPLPKSTHPPTLCLPEFQGPFLGGLGWKLSVSI